MDYRNIKNTGGMITVLHNHKYDRAALRLAAEEAIITFSKNDERVVTVVMPKCPTVYADYGTNGHIVAYVGSSSVKHGQIIAKEKMGLGNVRVI